MLLPMPASRAATVLALAAALVGGGLCACSTSTGGTGQQAPPASPAASAANSSAPAFPSTPPAAATSAQTSASTPSLPPSSSVAHPAPAHPLRTVRVSDTASGTSYLVQIWEQVTTTNCAAHAYGKPIINYLKAHHCDGLRQILATTEVGGRAVGFEQNSIGFAGPAPQVYEVAGQFEVLVTEDGTGNLNDLLREGYRLPSGPTQLPSPDAFDAEGQDNSVTVVDAWYLSGPTPENAPPLVQLAKDTFLRF
jgi:hypothetical protein